MLRHRKSSSYLNESATLLDKVYDAANELIDALEDSSLSPSQIDSRIERITEYVKRGERDYDVNLVCQKTYDLDEDKDVAVSARKYARAVYNVIEEAINALSVTSGKRI